MMQSRMAVSFEWIDQCATVGVMVDPRPFEITFNNDVEQTRASHVTMSRPILKDIEYDSNHLDTIAHEFIGVTGRSNNPATTGMATGPAVVEDMNEDSDSEPDIPLAQQ